jgi:hypothetical protein
MSNEQGAPEHRVVSVGSSAGPLTVLNGFVLLAGNLAGGLCAIYADLFPRSSLGEERGVLSVAFAAAGLLVTPWVLSFNDPRPETKKISERIRYGYQVLAKRPSFAVMVAFMLVISAWCASSRMQKESEHSGNLRALVNYADRTEAAARAAEAAANRTEVAVQQVDRKANELLIKTSRIEQEVTRPLTPREALAKRGVQWEARSYQQALVNGDLDVLSDLLAAGWRADSAEPSGDGNSLGHLFGRTPAHARTVDTIKILMRHTDLTAANVKLGASPTRNAASVAAGTCNRSMIEALAKAGVNVKLQNKPATYPGGDIEPNIETRLQNWRPMSWDFHLCEPADREAILALIRPVTYR